MRVLIAVTHLLGVGHLARAAALGRAFVAAGHQVTLISGGRPAPNVRTEGMTLVQLPPIHIQGTDFKTLFEQDGVVVSAATMAARTAVLVEALQRTAPDAVIVELFPFGRRQLNAEFVELLEKAGKLDRPPAVFCSIRDILNPTSDKKKIDRTVSQLGAYFDGVLVHADPAILPLDASWPVDPSLARRLHYTGYVRDGGASPASTQNATRAGILVSGGGSAASLPLMQAALAAAALDGHRPWRLLVGHGVAEQAFRDLQDAAPANAVVERVRRDFLMLLASAACSVSLFGYNTALDLAEAGTPAVVVPFDGGNEVEQSIRAARFAAMALVELVAAADLTPVSLLAAVSRAISKPVGRQQALAMDGAARSVEIVSQGVAEKREVAAAWARVRDALDRVASRCETVRFWWRDDDAIEPTQALARLLALREKHNLPLALAVIPGRATPALAEALSGQTGVSVLVHGIAHRNNAGEGQKKQELVAADDATLQGLSAGRARLQSLFGNAALPVLVPPWNRIAPEVIAALPGLGFRGLSTYGDALGARNEPLHIVDTHIDPIHWKAGGGLVPLVRMLERLAGLIAAQQQVGVTAQPIGLLTHHLVHDAWIWRFLDVALALLAAHPAVSFVGANHAFGLQQGAVRQGGG